MKPGYRILADNVDVTQKIKTRFVSMQLTDNAGFANDRLVLTLDDRKPHLTFPKKQIKLTVSIGYLIDPAAEKPYQQLIKRGTFIVDEIHYEKAPTRSITIVARANDTGGDLKGIRTQSWDSTNLAQVVKTIALDNKYEPVVDPQYINVPIQHLDQQVESDQSLLSRLASTYDAIFKVVDGKLFFTPRSQEKNQNGQAVPTVKVPEDELATWKYIDQSRSLHQTITAVSHNYDTAEQELQIVNGNPEAKNNSDVGLPQMLPTTDEAYSAAASTSTQLDREIETFSFTAVGMPHLFAEQKVQITGLREGIRDTWLMKSVSYDYSEGGFTVSVDCEIPK